MRIVGDHIILRTVNSGDIDVLFKWENNPDVSKFNVNNEVVSKEDLKRFINGPHDIYLDGQLRLMITLASNDEVIGTLDLFEYDKIKSKGFVRLPENTSSNLLAHKLEGMDLYCFDCL